MRAASLLLALLCAPQEAAPEGGAPPPSSGGTDGVAPAARAPVAGIGGFLSVSRVVFASRPGDPHELRAMYTFPDRARWWIGVPDGAPRRRTLEYRFGTHVFQIPYGRSDSIPIEGDERDAALRRFELRRIAMLWPDGAAWGPPEKGRRRAPLAAGGAPIGEVVAVLGEDDRPRHLVVVDPASEPQETLEILGWSEGFGRAWPSAMKLFVGSELVWEETVERADPRERYLDDYFLPPDRRELLGERGEREVEGILRAELPAETRRVVAFDRPLGWDEARARALEIAERERAAGRALAGEPVLLLDATRGSATGCALALAVATDTPPAGYAVRPGGPAVALASRDEPASVVAGIRRLRAALPEGAEAGALELVREPDHEDGGRWLLFLLHGD